MGNSRIRELTEIALTGVLAFLLSFIKLKLSPSLSASLAVIPLWLFALRRGWGNGAVAGLLYGLLRIITGTASYLTIFQVVIEYPFAYLLAGIAGFWASRAQNFAATGNRMQLGITAGIATFAAAAAEYFIHFLAGWVFWASFAPEGMSAWLYSLLTNGASGIATWFIGFIAIFLILLAAPRLITDKK